MYEGAINQAQDEFFCHEEAILVKAPMRLRRLRLTVSDKEIIAYKKVRLKIICT